MTQYVKGMVQVAGKTFRIERVGPSLYDVIRIEDDARIGKFQTAPVKVLAHDVDYELLRDIALAAVHEGKTSWVHRLPFRSVL
jgi:hypothetical protein